MIEVTNNPIRTWRLMMEFNTAELRPIAEKFAQVIQQGLAEQPDAPIREIETGMRQWLQCLGQLTLGLVLSQAEKRAPRSLPCGCGGRVQSTAAGGAGVECVWAGALCAQLLCGLRMWAGQNTPG
jgi:hypothetical protein